MRSTINDYRFYQHLLLIIISFSFDGLIINGTRHRSSHNQMCRKITNGKEVTRLGGNSTLFEFNLPLQIHSYGNSYTTKRKCLADI